MQTKTTRCRPSVNYRLDAHKTSSWEWNDWACEMDPVERQAARLLARMPDEAVRIERMLRLPEGVIEVWFKVDPMFVEAVTAEEDELLNLDPRQVQPLDYFAVLEPNAIEAAYLIAVSNMKLKDVARNLGVTPRTISNWRADPIFQQLEAHFARDRIKALEKLKRNDDAKLQIGLSAHTQAALDVVGAALETGDVNAALAVLRIVKR